jgi:hypothetical protein
MSAILVLFILRLLWYRKEATLTSSKTIVMQWFPKGGCLTNTSFHKDRRNNLLSTRGILPAFPGFFDENCTLICQTRHGNPLLKGAGTFILSYWLALN